MTSLTLEINDTHVNRKEQNPLLTSLEKHASGVNNRVPANVSASSLNLLWRQTLTENPKAKQKKTPGNRAGGAQLPGDLVTTRKTNVEPT